MWPGGSKKTKKLRTPYKYGPCANFSRLLAVESGGGDVTSGVDSAVEGGDESVAAMAAASAALKSEN